MRRLEITRPARRDIDHLLWESRQRHGPQAAARYQRLIGSAFADLRSAPKRPTSASAEVGDLKLYALRIAARRLTGGQRVTKPSHVIVYRFDDERVTIVRLLHEAMDLPEHLARAVGSSAARKLQ
ncbi:type II toxin-antitoxin system RelE/ParE family toxin [Caulobacter vibrioides]|uniref:type II toxin-antitoxin system RelE/ParE family toxin n=1 Tax=Caulobacter vibrioides TaxID=155892 RepID=UPI000BB477C0|nr:type II toxin-antitoxin system RelE/ParE family toxin [Caulobacter vibrioides]ATC25878.1 type II toxin-antitoxin system RelE/ParE family toxin [Caulobacter vibrioides]PLR16482.1 type II toxin-antitoxin system RelE/ParE family toxin [Caulobacter vibrioides]